MRTLLVISILFAFGHILPAQDFEGMAYVKAGQEILGPTNVKQNVGGSISIGQWPKTTFFVFDEYTAVLDENRNLLFEGGLPATATPGEKFLAEKEKLLTSNFTQPQEEVVPQTEPTTDQVAPKEREKKKKKKREKKVEENPLADFPPAPEPFLEDSLRDEGYDQNRPSRFGFGLTGGEYQTGGVNGYGYGFTANRTYPVGKRFRVGVAADVIVFHDFIFKKTIDQVYYDDMGYPVETESYKFPEGFAGAVNVRPFAGADIGCFRAGYQPVVSFAYHSIWGTNVDVFPLGIGVGFLRGPIQVDLFAATKFGRSMYYGRMRVVGASVTFGNRTGSR